MAEDPDFASGYMHLAWTIRNQRKPATEYLPPAERAVELADRVSERERYFILGSYHEMLGEAARAALDEDLATIEYEQAVTAYEAMLQLYPDHYWGTNNLANTNTRLGRQEEAWRWRVRRADLRPTNLLGALNLAWYFLRIPDVAAAEPYIERARALASAEGADPGLVAQASFLKVHAAWAGGDAEQTLAALNEVVASGPPQTSVARDRWLSAASLSYHTLGMLDAAHDMGLQIAGEQPRCGTLSNVTLARDDRQAARDHLRRCPPTRAGLILLARAGGPDEAREAEEGLAELPTFNIQFYLASDSLALAWLAQDEPSRAARVLEEVAFPDVRVGFHWLTVELRRAQVYRQLGRVGEAEQIDAGLRTLLAHADPDHIILRALKRLS